MPFYKGVSRRVGGLLINTDGTENTSGTITATVSKDGGAFASATNTPTRVGSTGLCYLDLTSTETNCDLLVVKFTATGVVPHLLDIYPEADYTSTVAGRVDAAVSSRSTLTAANVWDYLSSSATTVGSLGKRIVDYLDAAISSRSTYAGADTSGTTTLLSRIGSSLTITGGKVDVNDKTGFALSSAGVQAVWDALTSALTTVGSVGKRIADNLDATVSSRLATSGYTAPDNTSVTAIKAKTDNLPASPAAVGSAMTLAADAVNSTSLATSAVTEIAAAISGNTVLYNGTIVLSTDTAHDDGPVYVSTGEVKQMLCQLKDGDGDVLPLGTLSVGVVSLPSLATVTSAATITALSGDNPDNKFYVTFTVPGTGSRWRINVSRVTASGTLVFPLEVVLR